MTRWLPVLGLSLLAFGGADAADWPLFGHDAARSAVNGDRALSPQNVSRLTLRWRVMLGGTADSAPVVAGGRVFLTRRDGTTVALDAASGRTLWRFATHGPKITSSVPAYDAQGRALYVPGVDGAVHKLDPATGRERRENGFPSAITRAPETEKDASSLNLANGYLYAQTSGYVGDAPPYVGHVVAIRLRDGRKRVFNSLCSSRSGLIQPQTCAAQNSGMWARAGVVVDPDPAQHGRIYAATGNGSFDLRAGNYGDSILALSADAGRLEGYLTPGNYAALEDEDLDTGSSSPALLPRQPGSATPLMGVQGGKDSRLRLFDRTHLGGLRAPLQTLVLTRELFSAPAVWTDGRGSSSVYLGLPDGVWAYRLTTADRRSRLTAAWHTVTAPDDQGTSPVIDNGVIFFATSGRLMALDARTGRRLWTHAIGPIHWESPVIANGSVYCTDETGALSAFSRSGER